MIASYVREFKKKKKLLKMLLCFWLWNNGGKKTTLYPLNTLNAEHCSYCSSHTPLQHIEIQSVTDLVCPVMVAQGSSERSIKNL